MVNHNTVKSDPRVSGEEVVRVALGTDVSWVGELAPETIGAAELLNMISRGTQTMEAIRQDMASKNVEVSRRAFRLGKRVYRDGPPERVGAVLTFLVGQIDDETERNAKTQELVLPYLPKDLSEHYSLIFSDSSEAEARNVHLVHDHAELFAQKVHNQTDDNEIQRYELLKLLLSENPDDSTVSPNDATLIMLTIEYLEHPDESVIARLINDIESGVIDSWLVKDLIIHGEKIEFDETAERIPKFLNLLVDSAPEISPELILNRLVARLVDWPGDTKRAVDHVRSAALRLMYSRLKIATDFINRLQLVKPEGDLNELFANAMDDFVVYLADTYGPKTVRREALVTAQLKRKRRPRVEEETNVEKLETPIGVMHEPRELVTFDANGEFIDRLDPRFDEMVDSWKGKYKGVAGIETDVTNILTYLATLDFSHGPIRGVKQLAYTVESADGIEHRVFSFKPQDANALSTSAKPTKNLRVMFALIDNKIAIVRFVDRRDRQTIERRNGVSTTVK